MTHERWRGTCWLVCAVAAMALGCASGPTPSGFLGDYSQLTAGDEGIDLFYAKPGSDLGDYDRVLLDQVKVHFASDADPGGIDPDDLKMLTDLLEESLVAAVKESHTVVAEPGAGVLRVRVAITQLRPGKPVVHGVTSVIPVGIVISVAETAVTGTYMAGGDVTIEWEVLDSESGERLRAGVDQRLGRKRQLVSGFTEWGQVKGAFEWWADLARERLQSGKVTE